MSTRAGKRAVQREKAATEESAQGLLEIRGVSLQIKPVNEV